MQIVATHIYFLKQSLNFVSQTLIHKLAHFVLSNIFFINMNGIHLNLFMSHLKLLVNENRENSKISL